jgi:hypothetical protein
MATLKLIQSQLEHFDKDMLGRFEEFEVQLGVNFRLLETLKRSTHEFKPINSEILTEKTSLVPGPEGAIKYSRKTSEHPLEEKCIKCGAKRRLTTVDIG